MIKINHAPGSREFRITGDLTQTVTLPDDQHRAILRFTDGTEVLVYITGLWTYTLYRNPKGHYDNFWPNDMEENEEHEDLYYLGEAEGDTPEITGAEVVTYTNG